MMKNALDRAKAISMEVAVIRRSKPLLKFHQKKRRVVCTDLIQETRYQIESSECYMESTAAASWQKFPKQDTGSTVIPVTQSRLEEHGL